jgi:hypothetical protein
MGGIGRSLGWVSCAALLFVACGEKKDPIFDDPLDGLPFEQQAQLAAKEFLAIAKSNASKSCPRPVLRGEPLPGKAAEDIIAVVEAQGEADPCDKAFEHMEEIFLLEYCTDNSGAAEDGFPRRRLCAIPPWRPARGSLNRDVFDRDCAQCAPVLESLARAVAHEDACSPYLPGVRGVVGGYGERLPRLASLIASSALDAAAEGKMQKAAESLLDLIRFSQDFRRGGTSMIEPMTAAHVSPAAISALEQLLDRNEPLGAPLLAQIDGELAALLASEPHLSESLEGFTATTALYTILPMVLGPRWTPPGKTVGELRRPAGRDTHDGGHYLVDLHMARLAHRESCGPEDSYLACAEKMQALAARVAALVQVDRKDPRGWLDWLHNPTTAPPRWHGPWELAVLTLDDYIDDVREHGQTQFYLGALRLLAKYRALAEETKTCPWIEAFDRTELADARIDPYSGKPLRVQEIGVGRFVVSSPEKLELGPYPNDAITIRVKCPFVAEKKPPVDGGV